MQAVIIQINYPILESPAFIAPSQFLIRGLRRESGQIDISRRGPEAETPMGR
jgi:hypothetical protein